MRAPDLFCKDLWFPSCHDGLRHIQKFLNDFSLSIRLKMSLSTPSHPDCKRPNLAYWTLLLSSPKAGADLAHLHPPPNSWDAWWSAANEKGTLNTWNPESLAEWFILLFPCRWRALNLHLAASNLRVFQCHMQWRQTQHGHLSSEDAENSRFSSKRNRLGLNSRVGLSSRGRAMAWSWRSLLDMIVADFGIKN